MSINWHYFKKGAQTVKSSRGRLRELSLYAQAASPQD